MANSLLTQSTLEGKEESAQPFKPSDLSSIGLQVWILNTQRVRVANILNGQSSLQLTSRFSRISPHFVFSWMVSHDWLEQLGSFLSHSHCARTWGDFVSRSSQKSEKRREKGRDSGMDGQTELASRQTEERKKQPRVAARACHPSPLEVRGWRLVWVPMNALWATEPVPVSKRFSQGTSLSFPSFTVHSSRQHSAAVGDSQYCGRAQPTWCTAARLRVFITTLIIAEFLFQALGF